MGRGTAVLIADDETGAPFGNYTITVDPGDGSVTLALPEPLRHLANAPPGAGTGWRAPWVSPTVARSGSTA